MIQSQFDAAAKLSGSSGLSDERETDERPRKRQKTTSPIEDCIDVSSDASRQNGSSKSSHIIFRNLALPRDTKGCIGTNTDSLDAASQQSQLIAVVSDQTNLTDAEFVGSPEAMMETGLSTHNPPIPQQQAAQTSPIGDEPGQLGKAQCLSAIPRYLEGSITSSQETSPSPGPSTPKHRITSAPQTKYSSPLSSPPSELFDPFDESSTDPPPSSSRPSSPVSDEEEGGDGPSFQDQIHRSSTLRRSLSTLKGRELFDASIWSDPLKTSVFYTFATNLRQKSRDVSPTSCHHFIRHLSEAGKMVRCYTQNIDLLEDKVGLSTRLLLGPGSRSRFSTRNSKSVAGTSTPRNTSNNNDQPALVPSVALPTPGPHSRATSRDPGPSDSQAASNPDETSSAEVKEQIEVCSKQRTLDAETADGQTSNLADKPLSGPGPPGQTLDSSAPERDRGVECVFLHGSLRSLRCFQCGGVVDWDEGDRELRTMSGEQPPCPRCEHATTARQERGKRALGVGKLRPDIVLYGEEHPEAQQISTIIQHDIALAPDLLIIMGTSLKVHGLKTVVREFAKTVHNRKDGKVIFVNYTKPADSVWADIIDFWIEMDCDAWIEDLKGKKPILWLPPGSVEEEARSTKRRRPAREDSGKKETKKTKKQETNKKAGKEDVGDTRAQMPEEQVKISKPVVPTSSQPPKEKTRKPKKVEAKVAPEGSNIESSKPVVSAVALPPKKETTRKAKKADAEVLPESTNNVASEPVVPAVCLCPKEETGQPTKGIEEVSPEGTKMVAKVPKRPAAHRECKQNGAYWTTKILDDLAKVHGRTRSRTLVTAPLPASLVASEPTPLPVKAEAVAPQPLPLPSTKGRRGPRTKNTKSRKAMHEAGEAFQPTNELATPQEANSAVPPVPKKQAKRRQKINNVQSQKAKTIDAVFVPISEEDERGHVSAAQIDTASVLPTAEDPVLVELPVRNNSPMSDNGDNSILAAVKSNHRIRKPKAIFGGTDLQHLSNNSRRSTPTLRASSDSKIKATSQPKKGKSQDLPLALLPPPVPQTAAPAMAQPATLDESNYTMRPVQAVPEPVNMNRRKSFMEIALGPSPASPTSPPRYLQPMLMDLSPRKRWDYPSILYQAPPPPCNLPPQRPLAFGGVSYNHGVNGVGFAPQPILAPLLIDPPAARPMYVNQVFAPLSSPVPGPSQEAAHPVGSSPSQQLQRENEAAAALKQLSQRL